MVLFKNKKNHVKILKSSVSSNLHLGYIIQKEEDIMFLTIFDENALFTNDILENNSGYTIEVFLENLIISKKRVFDNSLEQARIIYNGDGENYLIISNCKNSPEIIFLEDEIPKYGNKLKYRLKLKKSEDVGELKFEVFDVGLKNGGEIVSIMSFNNLWICQTIYKKERKTFVVIKKQCKWK